MRANWILRLIGIKFTACKNRAKSGSIAIGVEMHTIVLRLDPTRLENPDSDIRYLLPDLIVKASRGLVTDDGYDYVGEQPLLLLYLQTTEIETSIECVIDTIDNARVFNNDLRHAIIVAVEKPDRHDLVYFGGCRNSA
jgi:hypothetical protein